jgi:excisionase family DNA binding protein
MAAIDQSPFMANESERPALQKIEHVLKQEAQNGLPYVGQLPLLVGPNGESIELPLSLFHILRRIIHLMVLGKAISIVPVNKELTTQESADLLNMSRPFLIRLLEEGKIPFFKVGTHRRIRFSDLMAYKQRRDEEKLQALATMAHICEDEGVYD